MILGRSVRRPSLLKHAFDRLEKATAARAPYWLFFRSASNSVAARAVILIPIVGYWIIFNDRLVGFSDLSRILVPLTGERPPSMPWRLFATYFGLCLIAVASALYQWRCPSEIKLYPTASVYVGDVSSRISGIEEMRVERALEEGDAESKRILAQIRELPGQPHPEQLQQAREHAKRNVLQAHYDFCNRRYPIARFAAAVCYTAGFVALLVPSIDVFWRVTYVLWKHVGQVLFGG
jgi:hypothetical protein